MRTDGIDGALNISIVDPAALPSWDESLRSLPGSSFFHGSSWAAVLRKSYGYKPVYFTLQEGGSMKALLPCMDIASALTGKRGVSLPFTDYCEPIAPDAAHFQEMFHAALAFGRKQNWKYLEIRGGKAFLQKEEPSERHHGHTLDLTAGSQKILSDLRDSTRRNIKKAQKENINLTISTSPDAMKAFYRLNAITRRDHGLPPQPWFFFKNLYDHILSKDMGFVALASLMDQAIAANVYLHSGEEVIYKYGASDRAHQNLRANNLVMWEAIKWSCDQGYKRLCFGRTEPENEGLMQFKSGWGAREHLIQYYRYDLQKSAFVTEHRRVTPLYKKIFGKLPVPILKIMGNILYRHMA
jgi:CelD/BcsL family acetyltransferase involved in cellulose biosynthesis